MSGDCHRIFRAKIPNNNVGVILLSAVHTIPKCVAGRRKENIKETIIHHYLIIKDLCALPDDGGLSFSS